MNDVSIKVVKNLILILAFFIGLNLAIAASMLKSINGENWLLPSSRKYAIQLRIEKLFGWVHNRDDKPGEFWESFWLKAKGRYNLEKKIYK